MFYSCKLILSLHAVPWLLSSRQGKAIEINLQRKVLASQNNRSNLTKQGQKSKNLSMKLMNYLALILVLAIALLPGTVEAKSG